MPSKPKSKQSRIIQTLGIKMIRDGVKKLVDQVIAKKLAGRRKF